MDQDGWWFTLFVVIGFIVCWLRWNVLREVCVCGHTRAHHFRAYPEICGEPGCDCRRFHVP